MQDYSRLLRNKNELSLIGKKVSKIQFYLARVQQDMICIRNQAQELLKNRRQKERLLQDKIQLMNSESHTQLSQISTELQHRITFHQENSQIITGKLNSLNEQQSSDKLLLASIHQRLTVIEAELGVH